ncbi:MAG: isochorismatase family protein [Acidobacteria bacterium]|nr:isochorismatase family protein [Acidobacteriota bacterium]
MPTASDLLRPETTTLLVIDLQEKLLPSIWEKERVVNNVVNLLRLAEFLKLKTILTTQYRQGLGAMVPEIACLVEQAPMDKVSFGCFGDERILRRLETEVPKPHTLLVAGIEAHICVAQTVLGALAAGYQVPCDHPR